MNTPIFLPDGLVDKVRYATEHYPLLTYFGFGEYGHPMQATPALRNKLLEPCAIREIQLCRIWLRYQVRTQRINKHISSYSLKHVVEGCTRKGQSREYISNGAFIAAMIIDGWKAQRCAPTSPYAYFNISRSIRRPPLDDAIGE